MGVEVVFASTDRDDRRARLSNHAGNGGADAAAGGAGNDDHAPLEIEQIIDHYQNSPTYCPDNIPKMRIIENMILCKWLSVKWRWWNCAAGYCLDQTRLLTSPAGTAAQFC